MVFVTIETKEYNAEGTVKPGKCFITSADVSLEDIYRRMKQAVEVLKKLVDTENSQIQQ